MGSSYPPQPVVEITNLTTQFGATRVHDHLDLALQPGEILALVGGSGSGKSTLLRAILLLLRPTAGSIRIFGQEVTSLPEKKTRLLRQRMGVMFQAGALFSSLTVLENIAFPIRELTTISKGLIDEIAYMKLQLVGLPTDAAHKIPSQLSGGMRKRTALARALAMDPELIFLDEPTSGLDPIGAESLDDLILRLRQSLRLTILMVTHDLNSLWKLADRVAILGDGKLLACDDKLTVSQLNHPLIKAFFHGERGGLLTEQAAWKPK